MVLGVGDTEREPEAPELGRGGDGAGYLSVRFRGSVAAGTGCVLEIEEGDVIQLPLVVLG